MLVLQQYSQLQSCDSVSSYLCAGLLDECKWCTRCGGPYFEHAWTRLVFGVLVVSRVPILHEECALYCKEDGSDDDDDDEM